MFRGSLFLFFVLYISSVTLVQGAEQAEGRACFMDLYMQEEANAGLCEAVKRGFSSLIPGWLSCGADPNQNIGAETLLTYAIKSKNSTCARCLLAGGARPNAINYWGMTALGVAVAGSYSEGIKLLLGIGTGTRVNASPVMAVTCTAANHSSESTRSLSSACVNSTAPSCPTALIDVVSKQDCVDPATVRHLLRTGVDVNYAARDGRTALIVAALWTGPKIAKLLINAGAKLDAQTGHGSTALMEAALTNNIEFLDSLLHVGAEPNMKNRAGKTALTIATEHGREKCVRSLLKAGAQVDAVDDYGKTPLLYAADHQNDARAFACAQLLLQKGARVNVQNDKGQTPLSIAAKRCHVALVKLFLEKGADLDIPDKGNKSALFFALKSRTGKPLSEKTELIRILIGYGANVPDSEQQKLFSKKWVEVLKKICNQKSWYIQNILSAQSIPDDLTRLIVEFGGIPADYILFGSRSKRKKPFRACGLTKKIKRQERS